jgi:hypothetical protein
MQLLKIEITSHGYVGVAHTFFPRISSVIIVGKRDIRKLFVLPSSWNGSNSDYHDKICEHLFAAPQPKAKAPQPSTQAFPTKGNFSKNIKKREHNVDKREVLQAHAIQVQTLQNELESLRAQLANLKGKSSQLTNHAQPVQGSQSREGPPRSFYGLPHDAMVGEYVLSNTHNFSLTLEFVISFCPSYFAAQEVSVALRVFAIRQVIHTDGLAYGSSPITKVRGARVVMPQSFRPFNMEEEYTLLARGEETITPQAARASNFRVPGVHVHEENTQFSIDQLMKCQLQMREMA